ncbi:Exosome component 10 [Halocaridina rubra]|uniref:Exosome complex component 10 homolog n=1 Tax=Halocaridina rubra TaxID=373956 RepID=A0AAN9A0L8_HALRR
MSFKEKGNMDVYHKGKVMSLLERVTDIFKHQDIKLSLLGHKLLDQFDMLREGNDALLERINSDIDEASGLKKNADAELLEPTVIKKVEAPASTSSGKNMVLLASRVVQKPQLFFEEKIDNSHKRPFLPLLKEKPNSLKPLAVLLCITDAGHEFYSHPYEYELFHWTPPVSQQEPVAPIVPKPLDDTPIVVVEREEDLVKVVEELKTCREFAVDLEHHSYRSYQGLACLMQISTREMDYIIDPLALRGKLTILNEVFTHPKITKVFHGADHDILWLQRDCGIYVVNMFDTHQAARILEYPHRSLAALLYRFCQIEANKVYQRADWRIRPLPDDFIMYARQDTHYLLYIYDLMKNELIQKGNEINNLITAVFNRSTELCMQRYEKPVVTPESHMEIYRHSRKAFNSRQMFALQALYLWRDRVAREQDENPEYVLPKHMLLQIAEVLPKEMQGILACCNPIPALVKTELLTMHTLIREAREQPLIDIKPTAFEQQLTAHESAGGSSRGIIDMHDLSQCDENPSHLPVLLKPGDKLLGDLFTEQKINIREKKSSHMFSCSKNDLQYRLRGLLEISSQFSSPYERHLNYLEMKPFLEGEKKKGGDQDRIKRIMDHFVKLTTNTSSALEEKEIDGRDTVEDFTVSTSGAMPGHEDDDLALTTENPKGSSFTDTEGAHEAAFLMERQITHKAIDSFLESARQKTTESSHKDEVSKLLSHFRTLAGGEADDNDGCSEEAEVSQPDSSTAKRARKKHKEALVLGKDVKLKGRSKTMKRLSNDADNYQSKKVKVDEGMKEESDVKEDKVNVSVSEEEDNMEDSSAFDYSKADYSFFQRAKQKAFYNKPIKEVFKGKKFKKQGEKFRKKSST